MLTISGITIIVENIPIFCLILWYFINILVSGIAFIFNYSLICPTLFLYNINHIASANNFAASKISLPFPIYLSLSGCLMFYSTIVMYFIFLIALKLLLSSV